MTTILLHEAGSPHPETLDGVAIGFDADHDLRVVTTITQLAPLERHQKGCTRAEYSDAVASIQVMRADVGLPPIAVPPLDELARGCLVGIARVTRADADRLELLAVHLRGGAVHQVQ